MAKKASNIKKHPSQKPVNIREAAALRALALAGESGWDHVELPEIASSLNLDLEELLDHVRDKADILSAITHMIDRKALREMSAGDDDSIRDRLFDLIMQRLDCMNEYRNGLVSIIQGMKYDPVEALVHAPYLLRSMQGLLQAAGEQASGPQGALKIAGLTVMFLKILRTWAEDDSADLSKTMATLDRDLGRAEKAAEFLRF